MNFCQTVTFVYTLSQSGCLEKLEALFKSMELQEEAQWWKAVQKRCRTVVGQKTALSLDKFQKVVCLEVGN